MSIKADKWIRSMAENEGMIEPFEPGQVRDVGGNRIVHIPTVAQEVFDVSGAGDTVIAAYALALSAGAKPIEAAYIANFAAGIVVGKVGVAQAGQKELLERMK